MPTVRLAPRDLQELQPARKLRAAGWTLPDTLLEDHLVRVYDTRLEDGYLQSLCCEIHREAADPIYVIGGDFISKPFRDDAEALCPSALRRWGPDGVDKYHLLVPPRPHMAEWFSRIKQQVAMEAPGTWITVFCVVPRARCSAQLDGNTLSQFIPQAAGILSDPSLEVRVSAVGERAPVLRVPANVRQLPPSTWDSGRLPLDRVLVAVSLRRHPGTAPRPVGHWIRGPLPEPPKDDGLELLRLEYILPPATRLQAAERALRAAVRRLAEVMGLVAPASAQLRQLQPTHGGILALLGVPRDAARRWLAGSGCGGLYVRPFWTASTGRAVERSTFSLLWLRGRMELGPKIWEAVYKLPGVYGLLPSSKDVAVRVTGEADVSMVQAQLQFVFGDSGVQFRRAIPGQRWWRFGPLRDAELWEVKDMIAKTGLEPLRGEFRTARAGPFRSFVYFAATGSPTRQSFDDGSWNSSRASLQPAEPPPRCKPPGPAAAPQSPWTGPRQDQAPSVPPVPAAKAAVPAPAQPLAPTVWPSLPSVSPPTASSSEAKGRGQGRGRGRGRGGQPISTPGGGDSVSLGNQMADLIAQVGELNRTVSQLNRALDEVRQENALLRQQLSVARGVHQHQPYALPPPTLAPLPAPNFTHTPERAPPPGKSRTLGDLSPQATVDHHGEAVMTSPPDDPGSKKAKRSLQSGLDDAAGSGGPTEP